MVRIPEERFENLSLEGSCFKLLLSSTCRYDCKYCPNAWRKGISVSVGEIASFVAARGIRKLFLSSSVFSDPDAVMERICEAGESVRDSVDYLHLKVMPHCDYDYIKRVAEIADRISLNFESPRKDILSELSSFKDFRDFSRQIRLVARAARKYNSTFTTQIILGLGENDYDALKFAERMYGLGAARVYYSPFTPVDKTPLENRRAESRRRVARVYRADALIRLYGVTVKELKKVMMDGWLPFKDPKKALAERCGVERSEMFPGYFRKKSPAFVSGQKRLTDFLNLNG